jgi:hypothetical protein
MNSRTVIIAAVALVLIGIVLGLAFLQRSGQRKIAERQKELERDLGNLTQPMTSSIRNFAPVYPAKAKPASGSVKVGVRSTIGRVRPSVYLRLRFLRPILSLSSPFRAGRRAIMRRRSGSLNANLSIRLIRATRRPR